MLGKLFSSAASSLNPRGSAHSSRPSSSLESVQEDIHTRNLLFPDAEILHQHQHDQVFPLQSSAVPILTSAAAANPFDVNADIELDTRDVRVVVMQEATSMLTSAALLYDSHPLVESTTPSPDRKDYGSNGTAIPNRSTSRTSISSPRRVSLGQASKPVVITQESTSPRNFGAFDGRRPSAHSRAMSYIETEGQRSAREYREEMNTFANCMFGASDIMAYKGTGTKVHIIPADARSISSPFDPGHGSFGRSSMRSTSRLAQSYTSENVTSGPTSAGLPGTSGSYKSADKRRVLITRIFPVPLLTDEDDFDGRTPTTQGSKSDDPSSYPFPKMTDIKGEAERPPKDKKPKQKRTPMYAIGLIVQLPTNTHLPSAPIIRSGFRGPGSFNEHDSFPSSFSSLKPAGWTIVDSLESSYLSDVDDRLDAITQHWDIIMRTLSHLQKVISENILTLLKQADLASPSVPTMKTPPASVSKSGKRVEESKPFKIRSNIKPVQLLPNALMHHEKTKVEVDFARTRIVSGVKTIRVVNRQGRWGIWREEARWVSKWAGGKEQGFFFYNLLTAFLGNHTDWLEALGPEWYRRRQYQQRRANRSDELSIPNRTLIIGNDKMATRRLIFLLSTFLRQNQPQQIPFTRTHRPSTATSFGAFSQSPPSYVPLNLKEESLRRRLNRRNGTRYVHSRAASLSSQGAPSGLAVAHLRESETERRHSDAGALKTANLPIPGSEGGIRKSSAATTTTVTPGNTVPHFSTRRSARGTGPVPRPGSSGSLAADDLIRSLKRGESTGHHSNGSVDSQGHSLWGSVISGFWSNKRRGSTNETAMTVPSLEGLKIDPAKSHQKGKLAEMVDEVNKEQKGTRASTSSSQKSNGVAIDYPTLEAPAKLEGTPPIHPAGAFESPVKTSIDEDGVIDIDVPLPDFLTSSFGSVVSSPSSSGFLSSQRFGQGIEGFEHYSRFEPDEDSPVNVGGWLPRFHPDFVLQAVPATDRGSDLEEDLKAAMRAEPTPTSNLIAMNQDGESRWIDVTSAIIADATNFTIKQLRLRRLVKLRSTADREQLESAPNSFDSRGHAPSLYGNPYSMAQLTPSLDIISHVIEEQFVDEAVISFDEPLIDAVEKIIAQTGEPTVSTPTTVSFVKATSSSRASSSRSSSRIREIVTVVPDPGIDKDKTGDGDGRPRDTSSRVGETKLEVPRVECRKILLGALEGIAQEVADSRRPENGAADGHHDGPETESCLREGIRAWFEGIEEAA